VAQRSRPMIVYPFLVAIGLIVLLFLVRERRVQAESIRGVLEYWVFVNGDSMPNQNSLMRQLVKNGAISTNDALLFTHIGLHTAFILRAKNPHLFHPEGFEDETLKDTSLAIDAAAAPSLVILRFLAPDASQDSRYLGFLPNLAKAISDVAGGVAIYDVGQKRLFSPPEFAKLVGDGQDASRLDAHVRVRWTDIPLTSAQTLGLRKTGVPDLTTEAMEPDERVLVSHLLTEAAEQIWNSHKIQDKIMIQYLGTQFQVRIDKKAKGLLPGTALVHLMRVDAV